MNDPFASVTVVPLPDRSMTVTEAFRKAYQSEYGRNRRGPRKRGLRPFIGVDGEGGNREGRHGYYLLRSGDEFLYRDGDRLRTIDCLQWLTEVAAKQNGIHVAFFFDYDVTMILQDLPVETLASLFDRDSRAYQDTNGKIRYRLCWWGPFGLDYIPHKSFTVHSRINKTTFTVSDTSGFFQTSFVTALKAWQVGTPEVLAAIEEGKAVRGNLTGYYSDTDIEYNRLECESLAELMGKVRTACEEIRLRPSRWEGAGCLAEAMYKKNGTPSRVQLPDNVRLASQAAYYGGRFEIGIHGYYRATVHEYDLASAYPWATTLLPCLGSRIGDIWQSHGQWVHHSHGTPRSDRYYVARISWNADRSTSWGPFPFRTTGGKILYPYNGSGWYWSPEIQAAQLNPKFSIQIHEWWEWIPKCDHRPFDWVYDYYAERKRLGKSDKGKILKLGLNSLYGKTAQSKGTAAYGNPVYAGLITSLTRARMLEVMNSGVAVAMVATDGIYTLDPYESDEYPIVEENPGLGDWEHAEFPDMLFIQPGLYWSSGGKIRTRGVTPRNVRPHIDDFISVWERAGFQGDVTITIPSVFNGARNALHVGRPEKIGQWDSNVPRVISYAANADKRQWGDNHAVMLTMESRGESWIESWPRELEGNQESTPYRKNIGGTLDPFEIQSMLEHPDFIMTELDV